MKICIFKLSAEGELNYPKRLGRHLKEQLLVLLIHRKTLCSTNLWINIQLQDNGLLIILIIISSSQRGNHNRVIRTALSSLAAPAALPAIQRRVDNIIPENSLAALVASPSCSSPKSTRISIA